MAWDEGVPRAEALNHIMTALRVAFDLDGTLADLLLAYSKIEMELFGPAETHHEEPAPEVREAEQGTGSALPGGKPAGESAEKTSPFHPARFQRERVWRAIEAIPDFWMTLQPIEPGAIRRLFELSEEYKWEVFFITQRHATAGATVQQQTHRWLVEQGFETPSVIPLSGGRGRAASALLLDFLIDNSPQNCVDVLSDSSTHTILLVDPANPEAADRARRIGVGVAHSVGEALDLLVQATTARLNPTLFEKLRRMVGWK